MAKNGDVGYGKPPANSQYKKGKSGNPWGRPKKKKTPDTIPNPNQVIVQVLGEPVTLKKGGKATQMTKFEALMRRLIQQAIEGDPSAMKEVLKQCHKVPQHLYSDYGGFRHNSESQKLIETFRETADKFINGDFEAFCPPSKPD